MLPCPTASEPPNNKRYQQVAVARLFSESINISDRLVKVHVMDLNPTLYWQQIKNRLQAILSAAEFSTWIEPLEAKPIGAKQLMVPLPNLVFYQGIHNDYLDKIDACKSQLGIEDVEIKFELDSFNYEQNREHLRDSHLGANIESRHTEKYEEQSSTFDDAESSFSNRSSSISLIDAEAEAAAGKNPSRNISTDPSLNPYYHFNSFVTGESNQFAVATCLSVAENPGKAYNPLFIYGSSGLGKTHLLHAVGNKVLQQNPKATVTYVTSEAFMNEMISCIRWNKMWVFRQKYRHCDLLLVDDIHFISGRKQTQEEFFHTFNSLYAAKKQIVITSDMFPQDIPDIEDRLRNRFQWGLIADIQPPSIEHRVAILQNKAAQRGTTIPDDVAEYIAKHAKKNVRELEGALGRIHAFAGLQGEPISMELAIRTFKDVLGEPPKRMTVEHVLKTVADHFKLKPADLKSKRRQRAFSHPRQIAMYLARKITQASYPEIGEKFGGKDHTTVMHNVKKIEQTILKDLDLKAHVDALERQLDQSN